MAEHPARTTNDRGRWWGGALALVSALAAGAALAAPAPAHADVPAAPARDTADPVIVRLARGTDPDAQAREAAARGARGRSSSRPR